MYTVIHDANLIIKYVPEIEFNSEAEKNDVLAQAHAMRAYAYFVMGRTWGGVPMVTDPTEGYDPGTYNNLDINGGNGDGATATIIVNDDGEVASVEITNNGTGYNQGDVLSVVGIGGGRGFIIRIISTK